MSIAQALNFVELPVGNMTCKVRTSGATDAPVLILLSAPPDVSWTLDPLCSALARNFRVLHPQRLDTLTGDEPAALANLAQGLEGLIESCTTRRAMVVGIGFGATIGAHLASRRPDLLAGLCMVNGDHPDVQRVDRALAVELAHAYAYVADFIDPSFETSAPEHRNQLYEQFWATSSLRSTQRGRYLKSISDPEYVARTARLYRANYRWLRQPGSFDSGDETARSAFGRSTDAIRAGEPRHIVALREPTQPALIEIPTLCVFTGEAKFPARARTPGVLGRFIDRPRIVQRPRASTTFHFDEPEALADLIVDFQRDLDCHAALGREAPLQPAVEQRDSRHIVEQYDRKIRSFRCPEVGAGQTALRGSHPKTHGVVQGNFVVAPGLPDALQVGLFGQPGRSFPCIMRFSSLGKPMLKWFHDGERDVRGVGLKILDPSSNATLNDFLLNTVPILSTKNGRDVTPQNLDFMQLEHLLDYADELEVPHVLGVSYYSQTPYQFGPRRAVKYRLRPRALPAALLDDGIDHSEPRFLRQRLEHVLSHASESIRFDLCVQFQSDPIRDPIEDPRVQWRGPYIQVAEIELPPQAINQPEAADRDEALSFHLYHCLPEHAPLGAVNRSRREVYDRSPQLRRRLNAVQAPPYPFVAARLEVCVVGSGVAGMGAAWALARHGHRVTVVELRDEIGGHACSIDLGDGHSGDPAFGSFTGGAYPNVMRLMQTLGVEVEEHGPFNDALSYSSLDRSRAWQRIEDMPYARHVLDEVERFDVWDILADENYDFVTAREYFDRHGFSEEFIHEFFLGSIIFVFVGHPANYYLDYPIRPLVEHSYLPVVLSGREPVCRVKLGSAHYMRKFREKLAEHGVCFRTSTVSRVQQRSKSRVELAFAPRPSKNQIEPNTPEHVGFDRLVLAIQPKAALEVLGEWATPDDQRLLGGFQVTHDTAIVHRDAAFMPPERTQWRHGNKIVPDRDEQVDRDRPFIFSKWAACNNDRVTDVFSTYAYNRDLGIREGQRRTFDHVKVTPEVVRVRRQIEMRQGIDNVWLCGSWMRAFTLHEDGLVSGLRVANDIMAGLQSHPIIEPYDFRDSQKKCPWGDTHTFLDVLSYQSQLRPTKRALTFIDEDGSEQAHLSYGELMRAAQAVADNLRGPLAVAPGERVLLVYLPGLDFITAFIGAMLAGATPVPTYPPDPSGGANDLRKIRSIVEHCGCKIALTTKAYRRMTWLGKIFSPSSMFQWPRQLQWHNSDEFSAMTELERPRVTVDSASIAFLQYTSGSTADPKGVMITHANLMHQLRLASEALEFNHETIGVCWVPQYHDLGLVGSLLNSLYNGAYYVFCSPVAFLRRPAIWGELLSRYKATATASPDFGYRLLLRKTTPRERSTWDLSALRIAQSAGEAVQYDTLRSFTEALAPCGVDERVFSPAYGLAEHVVGVTLCGTRLFHLDKHELQHAHRIRFGSHRVVGCGKPGNGVSVAIVDPETRRRVDADAVGEIWVCSPCVGAGYWGRPELTDEIFKARIAGDSAATCDRESSTTWLRTGDMGFMHHGELFVTGRSKDLIVVHGRNVYPLDLEQAAERATQEVRPGCSAAFGLQAGVEPATSDQSGDLQVVLCVELRTARAPSAAKAERLAADIRRHVLADEGVHLSQVVLLRSKSVPKTTSGKVRRAACRQAFIDGTLREWSRSHPSAQPKPKPKPKSGPTRSSAPSTIQSILHAAVFEVTRVDVDDALPLADQVALDSVEFLELVGIISQRLEVDLPVTSLTQYPTIETLADYIEHLPSIAGPRANLVTLRPLQDDSPRPGLVLVHPARGGIECFVGLSGAFSESLSALRQTGPAPTMAELAAVYLRSLRIEQPRGPYLLGGYSFGATVSREMAQQLQAGGESVLGLALIDEIHCSPDRVRSCSGGEELGIFLSVCQDYLEPAGYTELCEQLESEHAEGLTLGDALGFIADDQIRNTVAQQLETYFRNVQLVDDYEIPKTSPPVVLLAAEGSFNRHRGRADKVVELAGDHFDIVRADRADALAAALLEATTWLRSRGESAK